MGFKAPKSGSPTSCATKSVGYVSVATRSSSCPRFVENCIGSVAHLMAIGWEFEQCVPKIARIWNSNNDVTTRSNLCLGQILWLCLFAEYWMLLNLQVYISHAVPAPLRTLGGK